MDQFLLLLLLLLRASLFLADNSTDFSPKYFLNCGGQPFTTNDNSPRYFVTDSRYLSGKAEKHSYTVSNSSSDPLYSTARVFTGTTSYTFILSSSGVLALRLHFLPFSTDDQDLSAALFRVTAQRFLLLDNFSVASSAAPVIKEYFLWFDSTASTNLELTFLPASSSFAFVNAVEIFTPPSYLFSSSPAALSNQTVLETVHRINVGGANIVPSNDTMWRTWIPDDGYFSSTNATSMRNTTPTAINYEDVTNIVAPAFVYDTARDMNIPVDVRDANPNFNFKVTWNFTVNAGYNYLVRAHFCDFISPAFEYNPIIFNLSVANQLMEINPRDHVDFSSVPFYWDTRAKKLHSGWISISIERSNKNADREANGYLNGLEIFKFNDALVNSSDDSSKRSVSVAAIASASAGSAVLLSLVVFLLV